MYVGVDWTRRDVSHLSLVPVDDAAEALCGALIAPCPTTYGDIDNALRRCRRCMRRARVLVAAGRSAG